MFIDPHDETNVVTAPGTPVAVIACGACGARADRVQIRTTIHALQTDSGPVELAVRSGRVWPCMCAPTDTMYVVHVSDYVAEADRRARELVGQCELSDESLRSLR